MSRLSVFLARKVRCTYFWTVPFRMLTFLVFSISAVAKVVPDSFILIVCWELVGAIVTGFALFVEKKKVAP